MLTAYELCLGNWTPDDQKKLGIYLVKVEETQAKAEGGEVKDQMISHEV